MDAVWFEDVDWMELMFEDLEEALKKHSKSFVIMSIDGDDTGVTFSVGLERKV